MSELPQGWAKCELGEVCGLLNGRAYSQTELLAEGRYPVLRVGNLFSKNSWYYSDMELEADKYIDRGDLIYAWSASFGPRIWEGGKVIYHYHIWKCALEKQAADKRFLYNLLLWDTAKIKGDHGVGSTMMHVTKSAMEKRRVPLPPLREQRRIVRKLDTLNARTTRARTHLPAIEKLVERYKVAVLRSAFAGEMTADFRERNKLEPVADLLKRTPPPQQGRGGRQATTEVKVGRGGISVNVPDIDLPQKWEWVPLLRIARQETGHTPSRSREDWWGGDVCWMSIPDANIHHGRVIHDTVQKTNEEGLANSSARLLPTGTVVLSRTASVGYICILGREMATSQDFATWTCTPALAPEYLMYALLSEGEDIRNFGEGSTHTTIYFPEIRAFHIKLAPIDEQREIVRRIETAFAKIDRLAAEAAKALKLTDRLDQRILAKAFAGELVAQDPNDEPSEVLLERIRAERAAAPGARSRKGRGRKAAG